MNVTARLAVRIRYLPDFPFQWSDTQPQLSRQALTIELYLPDKEDAERLQQRGVQYLEEFLVERFSHLEDLQRYTHVEGLRPPQKSEVMPMKVLFKDEKLKAYTIDILPQLVMDANLDGTPQVKHAHVRHGQISVRIHIHDTVHSTA